MERSEGGGIRESRGAKRGGGVEGEEKKTHLFSGRLRGEAKAATRALSYPLSTATRLILPGSDAPLRLLSPPTSFSSLSAAAAVGL